MTTLAIDQHGGCHAAGEAREALVELREHIAVVTAGGAGLGRRVAKVIAAHGAHVVIGDLDPDAGGTVVAEIERGGGSATFVKVDVTHDEQLIHMVAGASELGPDANGSPEYGTAKAGLIRFTSALRGLSSTHGIRVSCVVPHWVGLASAMAEFARLSAEEQSRSGGLIDPASAI